MRGDLAVVEVMLDGPHDLIVLMALARDEHDITRTGCLDGIAYGLGASGHGGGAGFPTSICSMMASGSSVRGLSLVTTAMSAERAAAPILGRLP